MPAYVLFSYLYGLVPAALTGLILTRWPGAATSRVRWLTRATVVGAGVGFGAGLAVELWLFGAAAWHTPFMGWFVGAPSALSALLCAAIFQPARALAQAGDA